MFDLRLPFAIVLGLSALAAPALGQKILLDTAEYTHNWTANFNNLDAAAGSYVYFFSNQTIGGGPHTIRDQVRKCWDSGALTGGQTSAEPHRVTWLSVIQGSNSPFGPTVGTITIYSLADPRGGSDVCIAPFTTNPIWLVGGFFYTPGRIGIPPGQWLFAFELGSPNARVPAYWRNNNNTCLIGRLVFELQHAYNGTPRNQDYIHVVSIDEVQFPVAGGVSEGDPSFGQNEWGALVGNGNVVSHSRFISFSGNAIYLLSGQSIEGNGDGLEIPVAIAFTIPSSQVARANGVRDCRGEVRLDYGAGGRDWLSCASSGLPGNEFSFRTLDYFYAQQNDPASRGFNGTSYQTELIWSTTPTAPCQVFTSGMGVSGLPLDFGMRFDATTNLFDNNPKAQTTVKHGSSFSGVTGSVFGILWADGIWPAYCSDGVQLGKSELPRGAARLLNLCHPKASNVLVSGRSYYLTALVHSMGVPYETGNTIHIRLH